MTSDPGWMSIGAFAKASRLSVKALRHYDHERVLVPARVEQHTGYRYYTRDQLSAALRVALLRSADVSIPAIRSMLADPERASEIMAAERARVAREATRKARALALIDSIAENPRADLLVERRDVPDLTLLWRTGTVAADTIDRDVTQLIDALMAEAAGLGISTTAPVVGVYPALLEGDVDIGVGIEADGGEKVLAGGAFASVDFVGPVALLPLAYHRLFDWLQANDVAAGGPFREYYLADPDEVGPDAMVTRVMHQI